MLYSDVIKSFLLVVITSTLFLSCQSKQTDQYEELVKNLTVENIQRVLNRYYQDEFGINSEHTLKPLLESLEHELTHSNELNICKDKITHYIDSVQVWYKEVPPDRYEEDFYNSIFTLNNKLKNNQLDKPKQYEAVNKLIPFIEHEERDGTLYHYPYELRLYSQDTLFLARNNEYKFNAAIFHDHKGRGKQMNRLIRDSNYEDKKVTISTHNKKPIFKERVDFKIHNVITDENYNLYDSVIIKIIN